MPNHIQHSSQVVGYHNQLHLLHQSLVLVWSAKLTSLDADTSLSIAEIYIYIMSSLKIIDRKFSVALPVEFYALRLANLPSFKVDNVVLKINQLEKILRDIPTRTEVQSIVVLNSRPAGSRPKPCLYYQ